MRICRFQDKRGEARVGMVSADEGTVADLTAAGVDDLTSVLERDDPAELLGELTSSALPRVASRETRLLAPIERQEVWAAGVTYLRSKTARMAESQSSASAYDRVYGAERPELFFKATGEKVAGPEEPVGIRRDAAWSVPEPELTLVMNSRGRIVGHTIGNDMSSRDIEGENLLYLPQAKIYRHSCAIGPWIQLGTPEEQARQWSIRLEIARAGQSVFAGETSVGQIKRGFEELAGYLFRSQCFPAGAFLLTGTGIVPPDSFTLAEKDRVTIHISGIGRLTNTVVVV